MSVLDTNLRNGLVVVHGYPQALDTHFLAAVKAFPYNGKATISDRVITDFGEIAGCVV